MNSDVYKFTEGEQPCKIFAGEITWLGVEEFKCFDCSGMVSICKNCSFKHHSGGYDICKKNIRGSYETV